VCGRDRSDSLVLRRDGVAALAVAESSGYASQTLVVTWDVRARNTDAWLRLRQGICWIHVLAVSIMGCQGTAEDHDVSGTSSCVADVTPGVFNRELKPGDELCACDDWTAFVATLDRVSYQRVSLEASEAGRFECSDPLVATQICAALHTAATDAPLLELTCQGHTWQVVDCGGPDLIVDGSPCSCGAQATEIHPCNGIVLAVGQTTCGALAQTVTVTCEPRPE
jgi:hypothetical protein